MVASVKKYVEDMRGKVTVSSLSRGFNFSRRTMDRLDKKDLVLKVYKRTLCQALKPVSSPQACRQGKTPKI
uniref:Uncharacterized protein n=1 Tax=Lepeophtheirus salmonis TaxID=72036 RepID=A0A0K2V217_LEPSM